MMKIGLSVIEIDSPSCLNAGINCLSQREVGGKGNERPRGFGLRGLDLRRSRKRQCLNFF